MNNNFASYLSAALFVVMSAAITSCVVVVPTNTRSVAEELSRRPVAPLSEFTRRDSVGNVQVTSLPSQCRPFAPPVAAMAREKTNVVEGLIVAVLTTEGLLESVDATNVVPISLKPDIEQIFREAIRSFPCRLPRVATEQRLEIPFNFRVE